MSIEPAQLRAMILFGGALHFCVLIAAGLVPGVLDWRTELAKLPKMLRQLFCVYGAFIALTIVSFGLLTLLYASELSLGTPLARGLCTFIAVFWGARLAVQFLVFDASEYLTNIWMRVGYQLLTLAFILLTVIFGFAALSPAVGTVG